MRTDFLLLSIYNKPRLSFDEVCQAIGIAKQTGYNLRARGKFPVPMQDAVLSESGHPHAEQAVWELKRLRQINMHLVTHLIAVKAQSESAITAIEALVR